jgi:hypothetical protein
MFRGRTAPTGEGDGKLHRQIDRAYDKAETWVSGLGRIFGVDTSGGARDAKPAIVTPPPAAPSPQRALPASTERKFEIVEVMDASGHVTNGHETLGCTTRHGAEAVLAHLRKAGA